MARRRLYKTQESSPFWSYVMWAVIAGIVVFALVNVIPGASDMMGVKKGSGGKTTTGKVVGATKGLGKSIKDKF